MGTATLIEIIGLSLWLAPVVTYYLILPVVKLSRRYNAL
jgi:hypothetical protein